MSSYGKGTNEETCSSILCLMVDFLNNFLNNFSRASLQKKENDS